MPQPAGATGPYVYRFFARPAVQIGIVALVLLLILLGVIRWFRRRAAF